ncbi:hypothetical protein HYDPIDRAFT_118211 [Hydnomerulius pinastri MD-312]|uniref:Uncharacterized protein n=1 Tax=Hydnomerulius pinastri MD-312 TaxID=994086 RepID=A0A0C9V357_9AGAM|nr:hypothetical protein HYDPIDRAFT_118211 [Hydnomerulius pinastri MD-312]
MPSSPFPFFEPSGLVTFQHGLKARISASPLLKVPLTMRPLMKKRPSIPFGLKRRSTTISSKSSSSSASSSTESASDMVGPLTYMAMDSPPETPVSVTPRLGTKIVERFWPEEEYYSEDSYRIPGSSLQPYSLSPPPHYRRAPHAFASARDVPFSDEFPSRSGPEHNSVPLRFPF